MNYSDELYHHGIKGQRWGVRRYQNPDGTLTAAGKRRLKLFQEASSIAKNNSNKLSNAAASRRETNRSMHERYDGKEGWKTYAEDAYGTTNSKDYNMSEKDFKRWMSGELKSNLMYSDTDDKLIISRYEKAAKKWMDISDSLLNVDVGSISRNDIKGAKLYILTQKYGDVSLEDLVDQMN